MASQFARSNERILVFVGGVKKDEEKNSSIIVSKYYGDVYDGM
jgi:hypothetical protein